MSKAKTSGKAAGETSFKAGTEAFKAGFEKAVAGYDSVLENSKDNVQAIAQAAALAGRNAENLNNEIYAFTKQSFDDSVTAAQAIFASKSVQEAFERQGEFAKSALETYVTELTRFNTLATAAAKESLAPIQDRFQALIANVQAPAA